MEDVLRGKRIQQTRVDKLKCRRPSPSTKVFFFCRRRKPQFPNTQKQYGKLIKQLRFLNCTDRERSTKHRKRFRFPFSRHNIMKYASTIPFLH